MSAILENKAKWWEFFTAGGRHDVPLSYRAAKDDNDEWRISQLVLNATSDSVPVMLGGAGVTMIVSQMNATVDKNFLGDGAAPVIGFTQHGLHLPTIPLVRWADIGGVIFGNLRSAYARAANKELIADPGVGSDSSGPVECWILVRNADKVRQTIDPQFGAVMTTETSGSGQQWGTIVARVDPALGAEQLMEFAFLLDVLGTPHGMELHHTGGFFATLRSLEIEKQIHQSN